MVTYILHHSADTNSVAFVRNLPQGEYVVLDWGNAAYQQAINIYLNTYKGLPPEIFPSAVIIMPQGGYGLIPGPTTVDDIVPENATVTTILQNTLQFLAAIQADPCVTADLLFKMAQLLAVFRADIEAMAITFDPTILQSHWQAAITVYEDSWLTNDIQTMILNYASAFHIPLVAAP